MISSGVSCFIDLSLPYGWNYFDTFKYQSVPRIYGFAEAGEAATIDQ